MEKVENGSYVRVDYKGTLENGVVFDTSHGQQPLEVKMGAGQLIAGFERALMDMKLNEKKSFTLVPQEAYGERNESLTQDFSRSDIPPEMNPEVGQIVTLNTPKGEQIPAKITHVDDKKVSVDMNHPLAGETLNFDIKVVGISDTPTQAQEGCGSGCDCASGCD